MIGDMVEIKLTISSGNYNKLLAICERQGTSPHEMLVDGIEIAILEDEKEQAADKLLSRLTE